MHLRGSCFSSSMTLLSLSVRPRDIYSVVSALGIVKQRVITVALP